MAAFKPDCIVLQWCALVGWRFVLLLPALGKAAACCVVACGQAPSHPCSPALHLPPPRPPLLAAAAWTVSHTTQSPKLGRCAPQPMPLQLPRRPLGEPRCCCWGAAGTAAQQRRVHGLGCWQHCSGGSCRMTYQSTTTLSATVPVSRSHQVRTGAQRGGLRVAVGREVCPRPVVSACCCRLRPSPIVAESPPAVARRLLPPDTNNGAAVLATCRHLVRELQAAVERTSGSGQAAGGAAKRARQDRGHA